MAPAQIVFTETRLGHWTGRLLRPSACVDTEGYNRPVTWQPFFNVTEGQGGRFVVTMQGGPSKGGRRYATHKTLDAAQTHGIRWAGRRFRIQENPS